MKQSEMWKRGLSLFLIVMSVIMFTGFAHAFSFRSDIQFVVPFSAGGGSDIYARIAADIIQRNGWVDRPILVVNRPGGGGAVGDAYTFGQRGNPAVITTYVSAQITSPLITGSQVTFRDLTPIANLVMEEFTLGVCINSPYTTLAYLLEAARENPGAITIGGSGRGTEDELVTGLLGKEAGVELQYVSFNSTAEVIAAVMGGHVVAGIFRHSVLNPGDEGILINILATFAPERHEIFTELPTFVELGFPEVVFQQFRGIFGPPDMPEEAVEFWADVFRKVVETDEWQTGYVERNGMTSRFMAGEDFVAFLESEALKYETVLRSIGVID